MLRYLKTLKRALLRTRESSQAASADRPVQNTELIDVLFC